MTRKVAQNTRPSFLHVRKKEGLGTRLILGVDFTDTWYSFTLRLPGLNPCLRAPTTYNQCFHPCNARVYMYLAQFLDYSLSSWRWYTLLIYLCSILRVTLVTILLNPVHNIHYSSLLLSFFVFLSYLQCYVCFCVCPPLTGCTSY